MNEPLRSPNYCAKTGLPTHRTYICCGKPVVPEGETLELSPMSEVPQRGRRLDGFVVIDLEDGAVHEWSHYANLKLKSPEESRIGASGRFSIGTVVE